MEEDFADAAAVRLIQDSMEERAPEPADQIAGTVKSGQLVPQHLGSRLLGEDPVQMTSFQLPAVVLPRQGTTVNHEPLAE